MIEIAFAWTTWIFAGCSAALLVRLVIGPSSADRLTALAAISALVLGMLTMSGVREARPAFLDVAFVYDILGFLGILAIATFTKDTRIDGGKDPGGVEEPRA
ncbi:MAG: pH regulation protein F [Spirochaetae bacterium HGW-Spirochaetae-3]|jgi:multicomponent Na+:H+ antiporter subunit F|nr:MAG: pH regulation protein F [Spirochaetae bacterium HGW-Spirochaetae-3]